jgi:hypothetical protein
MNEDNKNYLKRSRLNQIQVVQVSRFSSHFDDHMKSLETQGRQPTLFVCSEQEEAAQTLNREQ